MRIAHVTSWFIPGLGYEENYLPFEEAKQGHSVCIITSRRAPSPIAIGPSRQPLGPGGKSDRSLRTNDNDAATVYRLSSTPPIFGQLILLGLGGMLRRFAPDIVHAHGAFSPLALQCLLLAKPLGYRLFIDDHSHELNLHVEKRSQALYVKLAALGYCLLEGSVSSFLPVTPSSARILTSLLGIAPSKLTMVHLGADTNLFKPSKDQREARRKSLGLANDELAVVSAGRLTREKDLELLIFAISMLPEDLPDVRLILVGHIAQDYKSEIAHLAERLGVMGKLQFLPFVAHDELPAIYNAADVGVWPGAPTITVLEALATGLSCVLPAGEPAYQRLLDAGVGVGFSRGNPKELASAIASLAKDSTLKERQSRTSRTLIEREMSWEVIANRTLQIYAGELNDSQRERV